MPFISDLHFSLLVVNAFYGSANRWLPSNSKEKSPRDSLALLFSHTHMNAGYVYANILSIHGDLTRPTSANQNLCHHGFEHLPRSGNSRIIDVPLQQMTFDGCDLLQFEDVIIIHIEVHHFWTRDIWTADLSIWKGECGSTTQHRIRSFREYRFDETDGLVLPPLQERRSYCIRLDTP